LAAGCGGSSDPPTTAARQFVGAVTDNDRDAWCDQVGAAFMSHGKSGGLNPWLLRQCKSRDLFAITASCEVEAVISGASVKGDSVDGEQAKVTLSSGATLGLQRFDGKWYLTSISGGTGPKIKHGPCAGASRVG
jgi:hypothetical protein